ncbi:MAG TPA: hypothetical protein VGM74_06365 [Burkholderiaceae bacterium]|jgi:hypothetical protein
MPHAELDSSTLRLRAGERRVLRVPAHARWTATRGGVRLTEPPRWLGERLLSRVATLREGESLGLDEAGWVTLQALGECTLVCEVPRPVAARLAAAWRMIRSGRATRATAA